MTHGEKDCFSVPVIDPGLLENREREFRGGPFKLPLLKVATCNLLKLAMLKGAIAL